MTPMEQFPGNQKNVIGATPKKEKEQIVPVVTGEVVIRKKSLGVRFKNVFFGGDFKSAARYIAADVLLPAFRNLMYDTITEGGRQIIFGASQAARRRQPEYRPRTQYNNPLIRPGRDPREQRAYLPDQPPHSVVRTTKYEVNDIIIPLRTDAEMVLERLLDIISQFEVASVADFYELLNLPSSYVDNSWGWTFLNNVEIRQIREGYLIDLPQPEPLR